MNVYALVFILAVQNQLLTRFSVKFRKFSAYDSSKKKNTAIHRAEQNETTIGLIKTFTG